MISAEHILVVGAGGHAKAAIGAAQLAGYLVEQAYDDDPRKWGQSILGVPVTGPIERVFGRDNRRVLVAIGDAALRARFVSRLVAACPVVVHPRAFVHPSVVLGPGTIVFGGAVIQPDVVIGAHAIVNANATVSYDCVIGDYVHLSPGVDLAGEVRIETGTFLGTGAVVMQRVRIGEWTSIGAGSAVVGDLPDRVLAVGTPAQIIRQLHENATAERTP